MTEKELVSFGNYLLSDTRKKSYKKNPNFPKRGLLKERLASVSDADLAKWRATLK